ncbi:hypothetical protein V8C37DRAFT_394542 [Trichoderma ceciliae]
MLASRLAVNVLLTLTRSKSNGGINGGWWGQGRFDSAFERICAHLQPMGRGSINMSEDLSRRQTPSQELLITHPLRVCGQNSHSTVPSFSCVADMLE